MVEPTVVGGDESVPTPVVGAAWAGFTEVAPAFPPRVEGGAEASTLLDEAPTLVYASGTPQPPPRAEAPSAPRSARVRTRLRHPLARAVLLGAALGSLCVALLALGRRSQEPEARAAWTVTLQVVSEVGSPVAGAQAELGGRRLTTDEMGKAEWTLPQAGPRTVDVHLDCPAHFRAPVAQRRVALGPLGAGASEPELQRRLEMRCDVAEVKARLVLESKGGEAAFWLGNEPLGQTTAGRLEVTRMVPAHREILLRAEPRTPGRRLAAGGSLAISVRAADMAVDHAVIWVLPRRRAARSAPKNVPYRL